MIKQFGRMVLVGLTVLSGAATAVSGANAAPRMAGPEPVLSSAPVAEPVQYYQDWRHREWERREAFERFQRREARREWRHYQRERHGYGYGYGGYGGGYGRY